MNKKLVSLVLSATALAAGTAFAVDCDPQFYVGAELQAGVKKGAKDLKIQDGNKEKVTLKGFNQKGDVVNPISKSAPGLGLFVGSRLNENFGVELGASVLKTQKSSFSKHYTALERTRSDNTVRRVNISDLEKGGTLSIKNRNLYADAMGYFPVDSAMDLIGSVGIGHLSTKISGKTVAKPTKLDQTFSAKSSKMGLRVGLGAQYKFTDNVGTRLMVRHQQGNKIVKNVTSTSLGMFYQF